MHENEVVLTQDNLDEWLELAAQLGKQYVHALTQQAHRQDLKILDPHLEK